MNKTHKFPKIRPYLDYLIEKFIVRVPIQRSQSVDESMVPYFGRH